MSGLRIVAIGGGTGLPSLLSGLARFSRSRTSMPPLSLTAIVAMSDDGGSSGQLRLERGVLPPGDVRRCLVALADPSRRSLARIFQHRFEEGQLLAGHALGNLLLLALSSQENGFLAGVERAERLLRCAGKVLPCTLEEVQLVARLADGSRVAGEVALANAPMRIEQVELVPRWPVAAPFVLEAIEQADVIVLGPGSLYSSVVAPLLVRGVASALLRTKALRILVQNLMVQPGETLGLSAADHVRVLFDHVGAIADVLLVDDTPAAASARDPSRVRFERAEVEKLGVTPIEATLAREGGGRRHDPERMAAAVLGLALQASVA